MTELFGEVAHRMPLELVEPVEKMINKDIRYRSTAQGFMQVRQVFQQVKYDNMHAGKIELHADKTVENSGPTPNPRL